jgi:hypothetical protein
MSPLRQINYEFQKMELRKKQYVFCKTLVLQSVYGEEKRKRGSALKNKIK